MIPSRDADLSTHIVTGVPSKPIPPHDRSRAIVPLSWSDNAHFQFAATFFGAGIASMNTAVLTNPLDIVKVRQQLGDGSILGVMISLYRREGIRAFMNGTSASVAREGSYSMIRLGLYEFFKDWLKFHASPIYDPDRLPLKMSASIMAGTLGSAIASPTDLIKIRMQAYHPGGKQYSTMRGAFAAIFREKPPVPAYWTISSGLKNLYRGVLPTVIRGWTVAAFQMPAYDQTKQYLKTANLVEEGVAAHLTASSFAGLVVSLASNPVDVIKSRMMADTMSKYRGVIHCVTTIVRQEGLGAFYKGFTMCWARLGTHTIVTYTIYEQLRMLAGVKPL